MIALLVGSAVAFGHGGPPNSDVLLWSATDPMVVASTHGLLFADEDWNWVCEEAFGASLPTDVARTGFGLVVASTGGLAHSADGCEWTWNSQFVDALIWDLATDLNDPDRLWLVADDGLWNAHGQDWVFERLPLPAEDAKLRAVIPMSDGDLTLFGFLNGVPTVWRGKDLWTSASLPVRGGQLIALGTDGEGNAYGRFPLSNGTDELLQIRPDLTIESILQTDDRMGAFVADGDALMVSVNREGSWLSPDQGQTWTFGDDRTYDCLIHRDNALWACPNDGDPTIWVRTESNILDANKQWEWGPSFADVSGPRCSHTLPVCDDLWPTVALEMGVDILAQFDDDEPSFAPVQGPSQGCGAQAALLWLPWWWVRIRTRKP